MTKKSIFIYMFFVCILITGLLSCSSKKEETTESNQKPAKKIVLKSFDMNELKNLLKNNTKSVILLNFWATWCGECRKEMPNLVEFYDKYKDKVTLIGLALDDSKDEVKNFMELSHVNFPVYLADKKLSQHLMINGIPVTFIFKNGKYVKYHLGSYSYTQLTDDVNSLLN
jgi:thiol-disulfide isomerase/thioredoxin